MTSSLDALKSNLLNAPERPECYEQLAVALWDTGNASATLNTLLRLLELPNCDRAVIDRWATVFMQADRGDLADPLCKAWNAADSDSPLPDFYLGVLAAREQHWESVHHHHARALKRNSKPDFVRRAITPVLKCLYDAQDYRRAIDYCHALLKAAPTAALIYYNLGSLCKIVQEYEKGHQCQFQALYYNPHLVDEPELERHVFQFLSVKVANPEHVQSWHNRTEAFLKRVVALRPECVTVGMEWSDLLETWQRPAEAEAVRQTCVQYLLQDVTRDIGFIRDYQDWVQRCQIHDDSLIEARLQFLTDLTCLDSAGSQDVAAVSAALRALRSQQQQASHNPDIGSAPTLFERTITDSSAPAPSGFLERTQTYCEAHGLCYVPIHPASTFTLQPPKTVDEDHPIFRVTREGNTTETFVTVIPQGRACWGGNTVIASLRVGAAIAPDNRLLADVSPSFPIPTFFVPYPEVQQHWALSLPSLPPIVQLPGRVAVLATLTGDGDVGNYFHWLTDLLPRVELLKRAGIDLDSIDTFLVDTYGGQFQRDSLEALGVPGDRVVDVRQFMHVQAEELVLPSLAGKLTNPSQWVCEWLRETYTERYASDIVRSPESFPRKRLYISRGDNHHRTILNEDRLVARLEAAGFTCIQPQTLTFAEQVRLFAQAESIVALHGAGLTNAVFCPPGAKIVELFAPGYVMHYYWTLSDRAGHDYFYLVGDGIQNRHLRQITYPNQMTEDVSIDLDKFEQILQRAGLA